jgi:ATPase family protein associated with various cellular activities (AAA)
MRARIVVKGASGAGKSTLARALARQLDVPHVELDALHWGPGWAAASDTELRAVTSSVLDDARGWIVDGNYDSKLGTLVLDRADLIVWLDLPLAVKLCRLVRRTAHRLLPNHALWNGNRESLKGAFWGREALFPWAVRQHFRHRRTWPTSLAGRSLVRLRSASEVKRWLSELPGSLPLDLVRAHPARP